MRKDSSYTHSCYLSICKTSKIKSLTKINLAFRNKYKVKNNLKAYYLLWITLYEQCITPSVLCKNLNWNIFIPKQCGIVFFKLQYQHIIWNWLCCQNGFTHLTLHTTSTTSAAIIEHAPSTPPITAPVDLNNMRRAITYIIH